MLGAGLPIPPKRPTTGLHPSRETCGPTRWLGRRPATCYKDVPGFCKSAKTAEIAEHGYVLTPGRYVGAEEVEDDDEPFDDKMKRLTATLYEQFAESRKLEKAIRSNLEGLGYGG